MRNVRMMSNKIQGGWKRIVYGQFEGSMPSFAWRE
jgi:hypothetical protein